MNPDADLGLRGQVQLVADLLDAWDLDEVTLVHADWGGALFLTAHGLVNRWTDPLIRDPLVRRDLLAYLKSPLEGATLIRDTEALTRFEGDALVLWSPDNRVMPPEHGHRLAELLPSGRYSEIPGAYVLSMLDEPEAVAQEVGDFLTATADS